MLPFHDEDEEENSTVAVAETSIKNVGWSA